MQGILIFRHFYAILEHIFYFFRSGKWTFSDPPTHYIWKIPDFFFEPFPKQKHILYFKFC